jgi:lipopolysaccharide export system permease protein
VRLRRIDRYLATEILVPFVSALAFLFMLLFAMQLLRSIDVMFGSSVRFSDVLRIAVCLAPHFFNMAMPVSFLFAVMLALGRWSEDRETVALAASGVGVFRLWAAPVALALGLACLGVLCGYGPEPLGLYTLKLHVNELIKRNMAGDVKPEVFYDALDQVSIYVQNVSPKDSRFKNVLISDERDAEASMLVLARGGVVEPCGGGEKLQMLLSDGEIHRSAATDDDYAVVGFDKARVDFQVGNNLLNKNRFGAQREEMTPGELAEAAEQARQAGRLREARSLLTAKGKRIAAPLATVAFALCAVPLALGRRRSSRALGGVASLLAYIGYYVVNRAAEINAEAGHLPPFLAAHLANLLFLGVGLVLIRSAVRTQG